MRFLPPRIDTGRTPTGALVAILSAEGSPVSPSELGLTGVGPIENSHQVLVVLGHSPLDAADVQQYKADALTVWCIDADGMDILRELPSPDRAAAITSAIGDGCLLAEDHSQLRDLASWIPMKASRVHLKPLNFGPWLDNWLQYVAPESPRVLMHDSQGVLSLPGTLHLRDHLSHLDASRHLLEAWIPAAHGRRDDSGRVEPRLAAWNVKTAAADHCADLLVLDRPEVVVSLVRSPDVGVALGLTLSPSWAQAEALVDPVVTRRIMRTISDSGCRLFVASAEVGRAVEKQGFTGPRTVLDVHLPESGRSLLRAARLAEPMVTLECRRNLLVAGHDFKFMGDLANLLQSVPGLELVFDKWPQQDNHSVPDSETLLERADIVFCEFASHNAVWYSWHKRPGQRLIVRFHGYELFQDFVHDINIANVDVFVFVSEFYRDRVISELGWPRERTAVVPNMIDAFELEQPKHSDARFHLGIAGIVPVLKRPDRALDLLEQLLTVDDRYVLHVRGRSPWDYRWTWEDPVARDAYLAFYERLTERPGLLAHVAFDAFGADMGQWFRRVGWMLSPSSRETFHLAPVEGMASGTIPVVWDRDGAQQIFEERWVHASTEEAAHSIAEINRSAEGFHEAAECAMRGSSRYDLPEIGPLWGQIIFGPGQKTPVIEERFDEEALRLRFSTLGTAAALDRLIIALLEQTQGLEYVSELEQRHPELFREISSSTRRQAEKLRIRETLHRGEVRRPPRTPGAAYLPRHGTAYVIDEAPHDETAESSGDHGIPTRLVGRSDTGELETLIEFTRETTALDSIQLIADAVTRRARVHRPQVIAVGTGMAMVSWGVLIAGRRLGVPVMTAKFASDSLRPAIEEFDGIFDSASDIHPQAIEQAQDRYDSQTSASPSVPLDQITVGLISDEFTERTVSERCTVVHIPREDAYLTVASQDLDVLFVESAWSGRGGEWFHGVAYYKDSRQDIEQAIRVAKAKGVPAIFWNKEDPIHFTSFAPTAALCDVVFTTDADRIPAYLANAAEGQLPSVGSMPFYAEPRLHHPLPGAWEERPTVSYAGTYYGQRFAERSTELDLILAAAQTQGLTIYDRQRNHPNSPYSFPEKYDTSIAGGLSYDDVLEAYKAHPVHINVNSVNDSPTMFSRRVVEIAASGSVVVSGRGRGIAECLPVIPVSDDAEELGAIMSGCLESRTAWRSRAWSQLRAVRRSYLAEQAMGIMLRAAGLPISLEPSVTWTAVVSELDGPLARDLVAQTHRPRVVQVTGAVSPDAASLLEGAGIPCQAQANTEWEADWEPGRPSTWAEDLLYAAHFVPQDVDRIGARHAQSQEHGLMAWTEPDLPVVFRRRIEERGRPISWLIDDETSTEGNDHHGH